MGNPFSRTVKALSDLSGDKAKPGIPDIRIGTVVTELPNLKVQTGELLLELNKKDLILNQDYETGGLEEGDSVLLIGFQMRQTFALICKVVGA